MTRIRLGFLCLTVLLAACGRGASASSPTVEGTAEEQPKAVTPPFAVKGDLAGLMLMWFDETGTHTADKRDDIPEAARDRVRVDSLAIAPEKRLDPDLVYIADVRAAGAGGAYAVKVVSRDTFDKWVDERTGAAAKFAAQEAQAQAPASDVIIYRTSWCGVCKQAVAFFTERGIPFIEKDVEADASAAQEMMAKLAKAGGHGNAVPVIDFHGTIVQGFSRGQFEAMIDGTANGGGAPASATGTNTPAPAPAAPSPGDLSHTI